MIDARNIQAPPGTPDWLRRMADYLSAIAREWVGFPLADGVLVSVDFVSGTVVVQHKLARKPRGFMCVNPKDATHPYVTAANWTARTERHITLTAAAAFTADVWFF